jgi:hypothetical protein
MFTIRFFAVKNLSFMEKLPSFINAGSFKSGNGGGFLKAKTFSHGFLYSLNQGKFKNGWLT